MLQYPKNITLYYDYPITQTSSQVDRNDMPTDGIFPLERPAKIANRNSFSTCQTRNFPEEMEITTERKSALDFDDSFIETMLLALKHERKILSRTPDTNADKENERVSFNTYVHPCPMTEKVHVRDDRWKEHYEELLSFKDSFGHTNVTQTKSKTLAEWVKNQRRLSKQGKLSASRTERLSSLGFEWDRSYLFKNKAPESHPPAAPISPKKRKIR